MNIAVLSSDRITLPEMSAIVALPNDTPTGELSIYDPQGRIIDRRRLARGLQLVDLDVTLLAEGMYRLRCAPEQGEPRMIVFAVVH